MNEYQAAALRTAAREGADPTIDILVRTLGLAGEAGEVADLIKKGIGHGHGVDPAKVLKELGDVLWYVATLADAYGHSLESVAAANIEKLRARYPAGFSTEASKSRVDLVTEDVCISAGDSMCTSSVPCTRCKCTPAICFCQWEEL